MSYNINGIPIVENVGTLALYNGTTDPNGWVICDGVSRSNASGQYNNLINAGFVNKIAGTSTLNGNYYPLSIPTTTSVDTLTIRSIMKT